MGAILMWYNWGMIQLLEGDCSQILKTLQVHNPCIVTDPPFNIGYHYKSYTDNMPEDVYYDWLDTVFTSLGEGLPLVCVHYPEALYKLAYQMCLFPERVVSWVYNSNTAKQHRDIAFFNVKPDFSKVRQPYKNPNDKRIKARIAAGKTGAKLYDWWNVNQVKNVGKEKTAHPCQMPVEVMKNIIGILPEDLTIVDPFMGSGTTGVACKELDRDFIGIEIDPEYVEIAKQRLLWLVVFAGFATVEVYAKGIGEEVVCQVLNFFVEL